MDHIRLCPLAGPLAPEADFNHVQRSLSALCFRGQRRQAALIPVILEESASRTYVHQ